MVEQENEGDKEEEDQDGVFHFGGSGIFHFRLCVISKTVL